MGKSLAGAEQKSDDDVQPSTDPKGRAGGEAGQHDSKAQITQGIRMFRQVDEVTESVSKVAKSDTVTVDHAANKNQSQVSQLTGLNDAKTTEVRASELASSGRDGGLVHGTQFDYVSHNIANDRKSVADNADANNSSAPNLAKIEEHPHTKSALI